MLRFVFRQPLCFLFWSDLSCVAVVCYVFESSRCFCRYLFFISIVWECVSVCVCVCVFLRRLSSGTCRCRRRRRCRRWRWPRCPLLSSPRPPLSPLLRSPRPPLSSLLRSPRPPLSSLLRSPRPPLLLLLRSPCAPLSPLLRSPLSAAVALLCSPRPHLRLSLPRRSLSVVHASSVAVSVGSCGYPRPPPFVRRIYWYR
jgi:hypothetical protein